MVTVKRLLPFRTADRPDPLEGTRVLDIDEDGGSDVFDALGANTTREVLSAIYDESRTASEVADAVDISLQNANYHLTKLQDAGLIAVGETWYSEQGNEMAVYVPTNEAIVLITGTDRRTSSLRETLAQLLGAVGVLAVGSLVVDRVVRVGTITYQRGARPSQHGSIPANVAETILSPGGLFLLGGLAVLSVLAALTLLDARPLSSGGWRYR